MDKQVLESYVKYYRPLVASCNSPSCLFFSEPPAAGRGDMLLQNDIFKLEQDHQQGSRPLHFGEEGNLSNIAALPNNCTVAEK